MVPNLDGFVLPQTVKSAFTTGQFNRVPVIEGSNHDEWRSSSRRPKLRPVHR
jgi:para-nitrobenzyl esterase